jgi:hypothetical protein
MLADDVIDLIALALVIYAIILAVALVLALRAQMRQRLRRAAMLTIWATASLFVVFGLGAAVNDDVHVSKLSTNGVGIIQDWCGMAPRSCGLWSGARQRHMVETKTKPQYEVTGYDKEGRAERAAPARQQPARRSRSGRRVKPRLLLPFARVPELMLYLCSRDTRTARALELQYCVPRAGGEDALLTLLAARHRLRRVWSSPW